MPDKPDETSDKQLAAPDSTAVRVALWRAMHVQVDPPPHVLEDEIGLQARGARRGLAPPSGHGPARHEPLPRLHRGARALHRGSGRGTGQPRRRPVRHPRRRPGHFRPARPEIASRLRVFEVDQPGPQAWKRQRLIELGFGIPEWLRLVPVDFEAGDAWWERLAAAGFDAGQPAVVASTGVSMYLTRDAIAATLRQVAALAPGSTLAMTFLLPLELADPEVRPGLQIAEKGARASGTPFISFFTPTEMLALAREAGFREVQHVSAATLTQRYFAAGPTASARRIIQRSSWSRASSSLGPCCAQ